MNFRNKAYLACSGVFITAVLLHVIQATPTILPLRHDANIDANALHTAVKGMGTNDDQLGKILTSRTFAQRQQAEIMYSTKFGCPLAKDIDSDTSGEWENILEELLLSPVEIIVNDLHKSMDGFGTDEQTLIEILVTLSANPGLKKLVVDGYNNVYGCLEEQIAGETSGDLRQVLLKLLKTDRITQEGHGPDSQVADADAKKLASMIGQWDYQELDRILMVTSLSQASLDLSIFYGNQEKTLGEEIRATMQSDDTVKLVYEYLAQIDLSVVDYYATRIHESLQQSQNTALRRFILTRSEVDLVEIRDWYAKKYEQKLDEAVGGITSGHYKDALQALIRGNRQVVVPSN